MTLAAKGSVITPYGPSTSGGVYRNDGVGIEYNTWEKSNNVGWIRDGAWLAYTVSVGHASTYTL
ncbi:carbohydrate-binding protein [Methanosphaerula palustris]|uniref:carbohydrate-binding protein n=1 Tax=Methanosphaerula palustris TaxID=475088 RepID=UPI000184940F|nr:carbohydrate-binding protein [Methanosphaerula palustris]